MSVNSSTKNGQKAFVAQVNQSNGKPTFTRPIKQQYFGVWTGAGESDGVSFG